MTQPLALVLYEKLLPGSQLVNRLQDMNYRVQTLADPVLLVQTAEQVKPMLVLADLEPAAKNVSAAISRLKEGPSTKHLPVIAICAEGSKDLQDAARNAGANLVVSDVAILGHLEQFLEQALHLE